MHPFLRTALLVAGLGAASGCLDDPATSTNANGIVCETELKVAGTFTQTEAQPADIFGCWPVGTWVFTATVDTSIVNKDQCGTAPTLLPEYKFEGKTVVDASGESVQEFSYLTDPTAHTRVKVSSIGGNRCQGGVEVFSPDGKQYWNFKPTMTSPPAGMKTAVIDGAGQFAIYTTDQWN